MTSSVGLLEIKSNDVVCRRLYSHESELNWVRFGLSVWWLSWKFMSSRALLMIFMVCERGGGPLVSAGSNHPIKMLHNAAFPSSLTYCPRPASALRCPSAQQQFPLIRDWDKRYPCLLSRLNCLPVIQITLGFSDPRRDLLIYSILKRGFILKEYSRERIPRI